MTYFDGYDPLIRSEFCFWFTFIVAIVIGVLLYLEIRQLRKENEELKQQNRRLEQTIKRIKEQNVIKFRRTKI